MKKAVISVAVFGLLFAGGLTKSFGQASTNRVFVTNIVQALNVHLTGFRQDTSASSEGNMVVKPVHITTRDILNALETATGKTFSRRARLLFIGPADNSSPGFLTVRDISGGVIEDTDVAPYFSNSSVGEPVERSRAIDDRTTGLQYSIQTYGLTTGDLVLTLQGLTTTSLANNSFTASVTGTGVVNGENAVLRGTVNGSPERSTRYRVE